MEYQEAKNCDRALKCVVSSLKISSIDVCFVVFCFVGFFCFFVFCSFKGQWLKMDFKK